MSVPSLVDRAAEEVAYCIVEGKSTAITKPLDPYLSNEVFEKLTKVYGHPDGVMIKMMMNHITPTIVDLSRAQIKKSIVPYLKTLNLKELKLGEYEELAKYVTPLIYGNTERTVDIARLLRDILNENSRKQLKTLGLTSHLINSKRCQFNGNWTKIIGQMLPNLTILQISGKKLSSIGFENITEFFPNLIELDIRDTGISSLKGISKLKNLKNLSVGQNPIGKEELVDLFNCKNLERLNVSGWRMFHCKILSALADSDVVLPELEYLNCVDLRMHDDDLQKIVEKHPKLKTVAANDTGVTLHEMTGITLYTNITTESQIRSMAHFREETDRFSLISLLKSVSCTRYSELLLENNRDKVQEYITELTKIVNAFDTDFEVINTASRVYDRILSTIHDIDITDKTSIMRSLIKITSILRNFREYDTKDACVWSHLNGNIDILQNNMNEMCSEAMECIVSKNMSDASKHHAVNVLTSSLTEINVDSTCYKYVDMKQLCANLRRIHRGRSGWSQTEKRNAHSIMQFVQEKFM